MLRLLEHRGFTSITIGYTLFLTVGSLVNTGEVVNAPTNFDKVLHFTAYFGLAVLWMCWNIFRKPAAGHRLKLKNLSLIALLVVVYGIIIEILQGVFTTYRIPDGWDIMANTIGVVLALGLVWLLINKTRMLKRKF